ncbi:hypothetical protein SDC9_103220 [bioreactor metagenome]|uniref:Uncharacterized protein n=1 Tax=bioreactor metagenome TaxID=1076179 RepID=A0A645ATL3_9ZZZZ
MFQCSINFRHTFVIIATNAVGPVQSLGREALVEIIFSIIHVIVVVLLCIVRVSNLKIPTFQTMLGTVVNKPDNRRIQIQIRIVDLLHKRLAAFIHTCIAILPEKKNVSYPSHIVCIHFV